jgi:hypothetical protein
MEVKPLRKKINPAWAAAKGRHPTWNCFEESRHYWRKTFYTRGVLKGKRVKQKRRKWSRETIRKGKFTMFNKVEVCVEIERETDDAYLVTDDGENKVWIPKSQVEPEQGCGPGDTVVFVMSEWLATEIEFI